MRVVQFKIRSCFRTEVRPRNQHTPIPKLALVTLFRLQWQEYGMCQQKEGIFFESEKKIRPKIFLQIWSWNF